MKCQKKIAAGLAALLMITLLLPLTALAASLGRGDKGLAVEAIQVVLKQEGYLSGSCGGSFDSATETALKKYQKAKGLTQDGKAGTKTLTAMGLLSNAPSIGKAAVNEASTNLRRGASTSHQVLCNLKRGEKLTVLAVSGSWYKVRTSFDIEGYVYKSYCKAEGVISSGSSSAEPSVNATDTATVVNVNQAVNMRKSPSTDSARIGTVAKGAKVWILSASGDWYKVRTDNGVEGYISKKYLKLSGSASQGTGETATVVNVNVAVNMRQSASTSSAVVAQLKKGTVVNIVSSTGSWYQVNTLDGKTGFVSKSYLKLNTSTSAPVSGGTVTITANRKVGTVINVNVAVNMRQKADTSASIVAKVAKGKKVNVLQESGSWYQVQTDDGKQGYISKTYLRVETVQNSETIESNKNTLYDKPVVGSVINVSDQLKIRAKATTSSQVKGYLRSNAAVTVYGKDGEWYQISSVTGIIGYCHEDYIKLTNTPANEGNAGGTGIAAPSDCPIKRTLRSGMDNSDVVTMQKRLKELGYFNGSCTGYYGSKTLSAVKAFQAANGLGKDGVAGEKTLAKMFSSSAVAKQEDKKEPTEEEKLQAKLKAMVDYAKEYLGCAYVRGGNGPKVFDCSGFTKYVFKNAMNYTLPRTAYTQGYYDFGRKITKVSALKLGDLVFFNTTANDSDLCDHVGIYVGNNQFIHASSGNGMKVVISTLGGTIYERLFSWGKRVFE